MKVKKVNEYYIVTPENIDEEASIAVIDYNNDLKDREPYEAAIVNENDIQAFWAEYLVSKTIVESDIKPKKCMKLFSDITKIQFEIAQCYFFANQN